MKGIQRRRITVTSSLKKLSTNQLGNRVVVRGGGVTEHPLLHQASGKIYKDVNGLSSTLDICFMIKHLLGEAPIGKNWVKKDSFVYCINAKRKK